MNIKNIESDYMWNKMELFFHVVKAGSFSKAANIIGVTQPVTSRAVASLENKIGHRLLFRNSRGITLTKMGEETFQVAQRMFVDMQGLKMHLNEKKEMKGKIRISTTHAVADHLLSAPLLEFAKKYPKIDIELICNDRRIDIIQNEVDVAIRTYIDDINGDSHNVVQKHIFTLKAYLYANKDYLAEFGYPRNVRDLDSHRLLTRSRAYDNPYSDVNWALRIGREGLESRKPFYTSTSTDNLLFAAENGLGIVTFYEEMRKAKNYNIEKINTITEGPKYTVYFTAPKHLEGIEKIETLEKFLMQKFQYMRN